MPIYLLVYRWIQPEQRVTDGKVNADSLSISVEVLLLRSESHPAACAAGSHRWFITFWHRRSVLNNASVKLEMKTDEGSEKERRRRPPRHERGLRGVLLLSTFNNARCGNCLEVEVQINDRKTLTGQRQGFDWKSHWGDKPISTSEAGKGRRRRQKRSNARTVLGTTSAKPVSPMKTENRHVVGSPRSELTQIAKGRGRKTFPVYISLRNASP